MELRGRIADLSIDYLTKQHKLTLIITNNDFVEDYETLKDVELLDIKIDKHREKRSLDANSYCWVLCQKIAERVPNTTKLIVYRKAISEVGQFEILPIKDEAIETFVNAWKTKGLGWICQSLGESKFRGYTNVIAYYGSSVYDKKSMAKLIEWLEDQAHDLGIQTLSDIETQRLLDEWEGEKSAY